MKKIGILVLCLILGISQGIIGKSGLEMKYNKSVDHVNDLRSKIKNPHLVAHAGGSIDGYQYTNTKQALDLSYENGFRLMEVDFEWTTDNKLVCLHSWNFIIDEFFNSPIKKYSYEEFNNLKMINNWQQLNPDTLAEWLEDHQDAYLITDLKEKNIEALSLLAKSYPHLQNRIIPQIYQYKEYNKVRNLGYENIILTLYMYPNKDEEVIKFAKNNKLFAVTMPEARAQSLLAKRLNENGTYIYTHTINDEIFLEDYIRNGVSGFYTDDLLPEEGGIKSDLSEKKVHVEVNGKALTFVYAFNKDGNVLVPFRKIFEALGAQVQWIAESKTVIGYNNETRIEMIIDKKQALVNSKMIELDIAPMINRGSTMVPIRFISENLGARVDWNPSTSTVYITK